MINGVSLWDNSWVEIPLEWFDPLQLLVNMRGRGLCWSIRAPPVRIAQLIILFLPTYIDSFI